MLACLPLAWALRRRDSLTFSTPALPLCPSPSHPAGSPIWWTVPGSASPHPASATLGNCIILQHILDFPQLNCLPVPSLNWVTFTASGQTSLGCICAWRIFIISSLASPRKRFLKMQSYTFSACCIGTDHYWCDHGNTFMKVTHLKSPPWSKFASLSHFSANSYIFMLLVGNVCCSI